MPFDKPKVTIDLEEYNQLLNQIETFNKRDEDSEIKTLKKCIGVLMRYVDVFREGILLSDLSNDGIGLSFHTNPMRPLDEAWRDIVVTKIK